MIVIAVELVPNPPPLQPRPIPFPPTPLAATYLRPLMGVEVSDRALRRVRRQLESSLAYVEDHFLDGKAFIVGDQPSIADLSAFSEIAQVG